MDNNNSNDDDSGGDNNPPPAGAGNGGAAGFLHLYMAGDHEMALWVPLGSDRFPLWLASVTDIKDYIADCNEEIRWEDGRPRAYERWLEMVIGFAMVWGVDLVPPDIVQSYDDVRDGIAGLDGIQAFGSLADEVAAR